MSTHCAIIALNWGGSYRGIYCHSDGYPEGVGETLRQHYQDFDKISALLDLGELSCVGEGPEREHGTIAYSRDMGEDLLPPHRGRTVDEVAAKIDHSGHVYVFEDGRWTHNGEPMDEPEGSRPDERTYADGLRRAWEFVEAAAIRWPAHDHAIAEIREEIERELEEVEP